MSFYRKHSNEHKRAVVEEILNGQLSKTAVCRKHELSYSLLQEWVQAYQAGRLDSEPTTEAGHREKIEKLEQMVGRQAMEIEFLKKSIEYTRELAKKKERLSKSTNSLLKPRDGGAN
jgi:transposase